MANQFVGRFTATLYGSALNECVSLQFPEKVRAALERVETTNGSTTTEREYKVAELRDAPDYPVIELIHNHNPTASTDVYLADPTTDETLVINLLDVGIKATFTSVKIISDNPINTVGRNTILQRRLQLQICGSLDIDWASST